MNSKLQTGNLGTYDPSRFASSEVMIHRIFSLGLSAQTVMCGSSWRTSFPWCNAFRCRASLRHVQLWFRYALTPALRVIFEQHRMRSHGNSTRTTFQSCKVSSASHSQTGTNYQETPDKHRKGTLLTSRTSALRATLRGGGQCHSTNRSLQGRTLLVHK